MSRLLVDAPKQLLSLQSTHFYHLPFVCLLVKLFPKNSQLSHPSKSLHVPFFLEHSLCPFYLILFRFKSLPALPALYKIEAHSPSPSAFSSTCKIKPSTCMSLLARSIVVVFLILGVAAAGKGDQGDGRILLSFKASADHLNVALRSWEGRSPCSGGWVGVACYRGRVVGLRLDGASLYGRINPLFGLVRLRVLSLRNNALTGSLPHLVHNGTSPRLRHLFLSGNRLSGSLNISLPNLASLRLENNEFSGGLEGLKLPAIRDFNISINHFSGGITNLLSKFPASAFEGNRGLCGSPLPACGEISRLTESNSTAISPSPISPVHRSQSVWSNAGVTVLVAIGAIDLLAIAVGVTVIAGIYLWLRRKLVVSRLNATSDCIRDIEPDRAQEEEKDKDRGLACFEGGENLRLDCLLKASAEVLGKGLSGSTYKAVLEDGIVVAVKRLSAVQFPSRSKAFDRQMQLIGRARHPNVVSLRAYCNANHERLLVYDYMPNGSLQALLQSSSSKSRARALFHAVLNHLSSPSFVQIERDWTGRAGSRY